MRNLKTTSFETWLKRTNKLMLKMVYVNNYSISVQLMNISNWDNRSISFYVHQHNDEDDGCTIVYSGDICNYHDERENRKVFAKLETTVNDIVNNSLKEAA